MRDSTASRRGDDPGRSAPPVAGECPRCGTDVPAFNVLIEYETDDGVGMFAECPSCRDVVAPS